MVIPRFTEESIPKLRTERNDMKTNGFTKNPAQQTELSACFCPRHASEGNSELVSLPRNGLERNSERLLLFLFYTLQNS